MKKNQKKANITTLVFSAVVVFLMVGVGFSFAQDKPANGATSATVVANVNVQDTKIEKQEKNVLTISFNISNNFSQIQPGILLSASLVKNENNTRTTVDEKIIGSEFTLGPNEKSHREISYTVPDFIQGQYEIWIKAQVAGGIPLSTMRVGETTFSGTNDFIEIINDSCFLKVKGEEGNKKYTLDQGVDIEKNEDLQAVCDLMNHSSQQKKFSAQFQTFERNIFGPSVGTSRKTDASFVLGSKEKKTVSFDLPKAGDSQAYDVRLALLENGKTISNPAVFHYVLRGASATIQSLQINKDSYQKGGIAKVALIATGSADNFPNSRHGAGTDLQGATLSVKIQSGRTICGQVQKSPQFNGQSDNFDIAIAENCPDPVASAILKDSAGNILAERNFFVGKKSQAEMEKALQLQTNAKSGNNSSIILIIIIALLVVLIVVYVLRKLKKGSSIIILTLIFGAGLAVFSGTAKPVEAVTFSFYVAAPIGESSMYNWGTGTIDKTIYYPNESIVATGSGSGQVQGCTNANPSAMAAPMSVDINGAKYVLSAYGNPSPGSATGTAPASPGSGNATFTMCDTQYGTTCPTGDESYSIIPPPQNGACGFASGTSGCLPPPPFSLCSFGQPSGVSDLGYWSWSCAGLGGGSPASCSAAKTVINASCGWASGDIYNPTPPTDGFCDQGQLVGGVSDNGPSWSWTCGSNCNGAPASCTKPKPPMPVNGSCNYNTQSFKLGDFPPGSLCASGNLDGPFDNGSSWGWNCWGSGGGGSQLGCYALKILPVSGSCNYNTQAFDPSNFPASNLCASGNQDGPFDNGSSWGWNCWGSNGGGSQLGCYALKIPPPINGSCNYNTETFCPVDNSFPAGSLCASGGQDGPFDNGSSWGWNCWGANGGESQFGCFANKLAPLDLQLGSSDGKKYCSPDEITSKCDVGTPSGSGWIWSCKDECYGNSITGSASAYPSVETSTIQKPCQKVDITTNPTSLCSEGSGSGYTADVTQDDYHYQWTCKDSCGSSATSSTYTKESATPGRCGTADGKSVCDSSDPTLCASGTPSISYPNWSSIYNTVWTCGGTCGGASASCSAKGQKYCGWIETSP